MTYYPHCKILVCIFFYAWIKIKKEPAPSSGLKPILLQTVLIAAETSSQEQTLFSTLKLSA